MITLPKLYAISDRELANLTTIEVVQRLLEGGARMIQLRDKNGSARELFDAAREVMPMIHAVGGRLIINDRVDVALTASADGVHLGQEDLTVEEAREILGPDRIIGLSTHSRDQFEAALATSADYIAVGPIFATTSKNNPDPVVGLELLREVRPLTDRPIVAIGGIDHSRAVEVLAAGADSVAVISALYPWPQSLDLNTVPDIASSVRRFRDLLEAGVE